MTSIRGPAAALIAFALLGCASSPSTAFLTLTASAPATVAQETPTAVPIAVGVVSVPPVLDRLAVVTQGADNVLRVDDFARWGAPLGDLARLALIQDIATRWPPDQVVFPNAPLPAGAWRVAVSILSLRREGDDYVLEVSWTASRVGPDGKAPPRHESSLRLTTAQAAGGSQGEAQALSRLLGDLADHITTDLSVAQSASAGSPR